jgi:hypothetical protein
MPASPSVQPAQTRKKCPCPCPFWLFVCARERPTSQCVIPLHFLPQCPQDRGRTTTRDIPWDQGTPQWLQRGTKKYYAICQLLATVACLGQTEVLEGAFAIMLPIQLSTFLMTLVRKSLITGSQWHFW